MNLHPRTKLTLYFYKMFLVILHLQDIVVVHLNAIDYQRLADANAPVPPGGTIAQVVAKLSAIAQHHGVALQTVKPAGTKRMREFDETAFEVEVTGAYRPLVAAMEQVDRELKPLVVTQFSIKRGAAGKMPRLQLRLAAYRISQSGEVAK